MPRKLKTTTNANILRPGSLIYHFNCWPPDKPVECPETHCKQMSAKWKQLAIAHMWGLSEYNDTFTTSNAGERYLRSKVKEESCPNAFGGGRRI